MYGRLRRDTSLGESTGTWGAVWLLQSKNRFQDSHCDLGGPWNNEINKFAVKEHCMLYNGYGFNSSFWFLSIRVTVKRF